MSVRLSVTRWYYVDIAEHILKIFHRQLALTLWFFRTKRDGNTPTGTPSRRRRMQGCIKLTIIDQLFSLCLGNDGKRAIDTMGDE